MQKRCCGLHNGDLARKVLLKELLESNDFEKITAVTIKLLDSYPKLEQVQIMFPELMLLKEKLNAGLFFSLHWDNDKSCRISKEAFAKVDLDIPKKIAQLAEALSAPALEESHQSGPCKFLQFLPDQRRNGEVGKRNLFREVENNQI